MIQVVHLMTLLQVIWEVTAWDVNCPQHIKPRFTQEEVDDSVHSLQERIRSLEAEVESCCPESARDS